MRLWHCQTLISIMLLFLIGRMSIFTENPYICTELKNRRFYGNIG